MPCHYRDQSIDAISFELEIRLGSISTVILNFRTVAKSLTYLFGEWMEVRYDSKCVEERGGIVESNQYQWVHTWRTNMPKIVIVTRFPITVLSRKSTGNRINRSGLGSFQRLNCVVE
jgi:hypothetical protein